MVVVSAREEEVVSQGGLMETASVSVGEEVVADGRPKGERA
jgi:hypothetical protein